MKELIKALLYTIIFQLISWGLFTICDEFPLLNRSNAELLATILGIAILIIVLIMYFLFETKIIKKYNLNSIKFNTSLIILWIIFSICGILLTSYLIDKDILHYCLSDENSSWMPCFLNGIEYSLFGFGLIIQSIIITLWKMIYTIYKLLIKK